MSKVDSMSEWERNPNRRTGPWYSSPDAERSEVGPLSQRLSDDSASTIPYHVYCFPMFVRPSACING